MSDMRMNGKSPLRKSINAGINTGILAFVGALVINMVNKTINESIDRMDAKPQEPDLHAVVD